MDGFCNEGNKSLIFLANLSYVPNFCCPRLWVAVSVRHGPGSRRYCPGCYTRQPTCEALKRSADGYAVYLPDQTPAHWHYTGANDRYHRIGDILLVAHLPGLTISEPIDGSFKMWKAALTENH
jgi:hypothetical protein